MASHKWTNTQRAFKAEKKTCSLSQNSSCTWVSPLNIIINLIGFNMHFLNPKMKKWGLLWLLTFFKLSLPSSWDKSLPFLCASNYELGSLLTPTTFPSVGLCRQQKLSQSGAGRASLTNQSLITTKKTAKHSFNEDKTYLNKPHPDTWKKYIEPLIPHVVKTLRWVKHYFNSYLVKTRWRNFKGYFNNLNEYTEETTMSSPGRKHIVSIQHVLYMMLDTAWHREIIIQTSLHRITEP